jgi:hypothetical protein
MSENEAEDAGILRHAAKIARRMVLTRRALSIEHQQDLGSVPRLIAFSTPTHQQARSMNCI